MLWPLPSPSPSRLIDTPVAGPVTTTWKDSNSFLAAAMTAVADAPCGGFALGPACSGRGSRRRVAHHPDGDRRPAEALLDIRGNVFRPARCASLRAQSLSRARCCPFGDRPGGPLLGLAAVHMFRPCAGPPS